MNIDPQNRQRNAGEPEVDIAQSVKRMQCPNKDPFMVVVRKHFSFLLIVVQWLKSNHLTAES